MRSWVRRAFGTTVSGLPTTFWWLWTGTLVNRAGAFVLPFLAFYLTDELDLTPSFVGLVLGGFGLGSVVASLVGGVLSDRLGRRPVLLGSQLGTAATLVVLGVTTSQAGVVLLVALLGLTSNSARPAFSAMTTDILAPEDRVSAFSLNYWAINLGFAIAPALGGLLAKAGYLTLFLADAATTLVFAVLVFLKVPESRPEVVVVEGERPGSLADVFRDRVFLVVVGLTVLFALVFMQHLSALPVQMGDDGLSASQYGTVIALNGLLIVFVTVPLTRWLQAYDSAKVLAVSSTFVALGFGATAWASSVPAYAATVVVWTIGEVIGAATGPTVVAGLSPAAMRGRYQGVFGFSFAAAAMVAPLLGGWVYQHLGGTVLWVGCGVVSVANAVGHLLAGPARNRRFAEIAAAEGHPAPEPTDAVPVPTPADEAEAEEAVRRV